MTHFAGIFGTRRQVSCKSFLKFQVGTISLGALFRESTVNTKSPLSNGSTAAEIDLEHCSKTLHLNSCLSVHKVEFLKQAKGLRPLEDLSGAVLAYDQNSSDYFHFEMRNEKALCHPLYLKTCTYSN